MTTLTPEGYDLIKTVYLLLDDGDQQMLRKYELTPIQYYALHWLHDVPRKSLSHLSRDLLCDRSNVTRLADILERKGLVVRQRDSADRRVIWISLTPEGDALYGQARQAHSDYSEARLSALSEKEKTQLQDLLRKLSDSLREQLTPT